MFAAGKTDNVASLAANYIEDVFSTYLYTGNGATQTITNGINLSGKGGLVWIKDRSALGGIITGWHALLDTSRGTSSVLATNVNNAVDPSSNVITSFNTNGFSLGSNFDQNQNSFNYSTWTFRKQAKFFDIVTYTGTGSNRTISHNLGSTPGCIIVKRMDDIGDWQVYHSGLTSAAYSIQLNLTNAQSLDTTMWNSTAPTSSVFSVGTNVDVNASGGTYVAYLFASNAGGFGNAGTDNVITCGSFTTDGSGNATVNLGYEPQWILFKDTGSSYNWQILDTMRGFCTKGGPYLKPNTSASETNPLAGAISPSSSGFYVLPSQLPSSTTFIYIAIRRGPMKTPTTGTSVFNTNVESSGTSQTLTTGFPVDLSVNTLSSADRYWIDRLRSGSNQNGYAYLLSDSTAAEATTTSSTSTLRFDNNTGIVDTNYWATVGATFWSFGRAPGFFDEVCYTGTGSATTITHNLGVAPEMLIVKSRSVGYSWGVLANTSGLSGTVGLLNDSQNFDTGFYAGYFNSTLPTSSVFSIGSNVTTNSSGATYVAYLFATVAGVSKVGTFTGTGGTQTINCGFGAGGARWLLVKRTDAYGNWYVFDSVTGFTSTSSPYYLMNTAGAKVTGNNGCYAASTGFTLTSNASATVNINGASYIFLAIA